MRLEKIVAQHNRLIRGSKSSPKKETYSSDIYMKKKNHNLK